MANQNIFVVGLDDFNLRKLRRVPDSGLYRFHELLDSETARGDAASPYPFDEVLEMATRELEEFDGGVDAIIGYWDYPVTPMVAILAERFGTVAPSLESVVKCEHKYWSRLEQSRAVDEVPGFAAFDPRSDDPAADLEGVDYPLWVKPVAGTGSVLGFRVEDREEFEHALERIREELPRFARGFDQMLGHLDLPPEVAPVDGCHCVAEEIVRGEQCTVSGFVHGGEITAYGVVDSVNYPGTTSFQRYEYPSELPSPVQERLVDLAEGLIRRIGLDEATFNVEFFHDAEREAVHVLEVNPRMSPSHGDVYEMVDGLPNHELLLDLALGRRPRWRRGVGPFDKAAKFFLRSFVEDARVRAVPGDEEVAAVRRELPAAVIEVQVEEGQRLSDLTWQEPHSYELANVFLGAADRETLLRKFERVKELLDFDLEPVEPVEPE